MKRFISAIIASFALHAFSLWCLSLIPATPLMSKSAVDNFVEFVDPETAKPRPENDKEKYIVRKHSVPKEMLVPDDPNAKRRFASDEKRTVLEETRAADSGLTKNRASTHLNQDQLGAIIPERFALKKNRGSFTATAEDGIPTDLEAQSETGEAGRDVPPMPMPDMRRFGLEAGRSTFGDGAPQVKIGEMTALNTDRLLYYSFYERAQDLVYHSWAKYVRAVLYSYARANATTGDEVWVTRVEIILDKNGRFLKGLIHQGSGLQGLDLAPVHAFREAQRIPNPPAEMIQADGTIRMDWQFDVFVGNRFAQRN